MSIEITIPKLGDNVDGAEVVAILVAVGDSIETNQSVIELESDKASMEVPSPHAGVIKAIGVAEGDTVSEGQLILVLEGAAETVQTAAPKLEPVTSQVLAQVPASKTEVNKPENAPTNQSALLEVVIPKLGDNVEGAEVIAILVAVGDSIEANQSVIELESDKASMELPSPYAGVVKELKITEGDSVTEGQVVLILAGAAQSEPQATAHAEQAASQSIAQESKAAVAAPQQSQPPEKHVLPEPDKSNNPAAAAPSVRRFARELGVQIHAVPGTGPKGRISKTDVKNFVKAQFNNPVRQMSATSSQVSSLPAMPDFSQFGPIQTEKASNIRKATARQMSLSWQNIPHVTQFDQADITEVDVFRKTRGKAVEKAGGKLTVTAILLKICALALKRFPQFNASIDLENNQIIYKQYYHLGMAVDTPRGLMVPVLRDVDKKGLIDISVELGQIAGKARDRKISPDDLQGATFTISNLGGLGTTYFTPIVNWPEVAILGVGRASKQPVWQDDQFVPRTMMPLSISYDHRLIDGADAARFLRYIAEALENPLMLLMEGDL